MAADPRPIALALQGGGSHGAFTWGALDRLLEEVAAGRLHITAISGASAGALNAALTATGLVQGGPDLARQRLAAFWRGVAESGFLGGNPLFYGEPGPFGSFNLDTSPIAIALEMLSVVVSPYTNLFYRDALAPLIAAAFSDGDLAALNAAAAPRLFIGATDVANDARVVFSQPDITRDTLRASAALPTEFQAVSIDGVPFWDGGFLGNPPLSPLLGHTDDIVLVLVNAFRRSGMPPRSAPAIMDRLNEITFNASVVLELNAIEAINRLLAQLPDDAKHRPPDYRPIHIHAIRDDRLAARLGFQSKNSTSWLLLSELRDAGYRTAAHWLAAHGDDIGARSSLDVKAALIDPVLKAPPPSRRR